MVRSVLAVLLGVVGATVVIMALEMAGHLLYPQAAATPSKDPEEIRQMFANMPTWAFLFVLLAYTAGSAAGGFLAAWIGRRRPATHALIVGGILMTLGLVNLLTLPGQPVWFWVASLLVYLPLAYLGSRLAPRPSSPPQDRPTQSLAA